VIAVDPDTHTCPGVVEVGVTLYITLPTFTLLGLVNTCEIVDRLVGEAPVIPPVIVPTVVLKVEGVDAVKAILVLVPLQIVKDVGPL
jgi:hypothetical protein